MENPRVLDLFLWKKEEDSVVNSMRVDTAECYRLLHIDTPLSPPGQALTGEKDPPPDFSSPTYQDKLTPRQQVPPSPFPLTEPSEFLRHHPLDQDARNLPDIRPQENRPPRRRRKLPQIPPNKKPLEGLSLAEEFREVEKGLLIQPFSSQLYLEIDTSGNEPRSCFKYYHMSNQDSPGACVDSGHSTVHSPTGNTLSSCPSSPSSSSGPFTKLKLTDATHRGIHRFVPRHGDELAIDIGDPVYIIRECSIEDSWCEGVNLTTGKKGVFPNAYVTDVDYMEFAQDKEPVRRERFLLHFVGSVEVTQHKGNNILCQAIRKIIREANRASSALRSSKPSQRQDGEDQSLETGDDSASDRTDGPSCSSLSSSSIGSIENIPGHSCILEVSEEGLRMVDRRYGDLEDNTPTNSSARSPAKQDYFFNLKNVTFCGYHPTDHRYFGFITKHPLRQRFACHIFFAEESARDVAQSVGVAFERFYQKFMEMTFPTEDIYIED